MRRLVVVLGLLGLTLFGVGVGPAGALPVSPTADTGAATAVTMTTATLNAVINPLGQATTYQFEYGPTTAYGQHTAPVTLPAGVVGVPVNAALTGLSPATTYHFRVTVTSPTGAPPGADQAFTTSSAPTAQTGPVTGLSATAATLTGTVNPAGTPTSYQFQYGTTTTYNQQTVANPVAPGTAPVPVSAAVTGLAPGTTYHYRVTATNASVTVPGSDRTFLTPGTPTASTLTVAVNPAGGNVDLTTTLNIGSDPAGNPAGEVQAIAEAVSSQFVSQLGAFGTCAAAAFENAQGPTAAACPDRSAILGVGRLVTRDQAGAQTTSDQGFIVKTAVNKVVFWWHAPAAGATPAAFGQVPGTVSQETGLYGPVVLYDFSTLAGGTRVKQLVLDYQPNPATKPKASLAPFAAATCLGGSWGFQGRIVYRGGVAPELPATTVACGGAPLPPAPQPSKLALARATITGRVIDILAPISRRASGSVSLELHAAGQHSHWTAPIDSVDGRIRDTHLLPASQAANGGTGILTIRYAGNAVTRPQVVRLRAGSVPAMLGASRPTLVGGHLRAQGTVSTQAHGVVRVQLEYYAGGKTTTLEQFARISGGAWSLDVTLTAAQQAAVASRRGPVESYILFTGYFPRRMRGEMIDYQVLGPA